MNSNDSNPFFGCNVKEVDGLAEALGLDPDARVVFVVNTNSEAWKAFVQEVTDAAVRSAFRREYPYAEWVPELSEPEERCRHGVRRSSRSGLQCSMCHLQKPIYLNGDGGEGP